MGLFNIPITTMELQPKYTLETLPNKKLLHFIRKDDILRSLPVDFVADLQRQAVMQGQSLTAKFLKQALLQYHNIVAQLRNSPLGYQAYEKYLASIRRITAPEVRAKSQQVRGAMRAPRKGFTGCVATKVDPRVFAQCAEEYDNPEYRNIDLVPTSALKQSVFRKTGNPVLAPRPGASINVLPRNLRGYMSRHGAEPGAWAAPPAEEVAVAPGRSKRRIVGEGECDGYYGYEC